MTLAVGVFVGCGDGSETTPMGKATGTITVEGKPLTKGRVNFVSNEAGSGASGELNDDGTFSLEGPIPVGLYDVFITVDIPPALLGTDAAKVLEIIPGKYLGQQSSDLTARVEAGSNSYEFDLK